MKIITLEQEFEIINRKHFDLFNKCYPHRIACPLGYIDPKYYSLSIFSRVLAPDLGLTKSTDDVISAVCFKNLKLDIPTYFIDPQFVLACAATLPPKDLTFADIYLPLDSFLLVFPQSFVGSFFKYCVPFVGVAFYKKDEETISNGKPAVMSRDTFLFNIPIISPKTGRMINYAAWYPADTSLSVLQTHLLDEHWEDATKAQEDFMKSIDPSLEQFFKDSAGELPTPEEDRTLPEKIVSAAIMVLMVWGTQPNFISKGGQTRKEKRNKAGEVEKEALWSPNIIGHKYMIHKEYEAQGGSHASPHTHWRRKHIHTVLYGPKKSLKKLEWYQPVLVNPPKESKG